MKMLKDDSRALLRIARSHRRKLGLACILMLAQSALSLALPWLAGQLAASLIAARSGSLPPVNLIFTSMLGMFGLQAGLSVCQGYLVTKTANEVVAELRVRVHDHMQSLPLGFYYDRSKGDLLTLLARDVDVIGGFISGTLITITPSLFTFVGALVMMIRIDWLLGGLAGLTVPVFFLLLQFTNRNMRPLSQELAAAHAKAVAIAEEHLSVLPVTKTFTREAETKAEYEQQIGRVHELSTRHALTLLKLGPAIEFAAAAGLVVLLWLATRNVISGTLPPASLVAFLMYGLLLTRPMSTLAAVYGETHHARAVAARLLEVLQAAPEAVGPDRRVEHAKGAIEFENVYYAYPGRHATFENLNLRILPGEIVAITGPNGTGKSTLVNLLIRFLIPDEGRILIDGIDVSTIALQSLRAQIGLVPQYLLLMSGSVRHNIAFGRPEASGQAIEKAARAACAHDFITRLPNGYDTPVGEKGIKLSGGQQQRIALARALLKNPPILVLDEATAMFDPSAEEEFLALTEQLMRDRTLLLITHRRAGLKLAHRILRLEAGELVQVKGPEVPPTEPHHGGTQFTAVRVVSPHGAR